MDQVKAIYICQVQCSHGCLKHLFKNYVLISCSLFSAVSLLIFIDNLMRYISKQSKNITFFNEFDAEHFGLGYKAQIQTDKNKFFRKFQTDVSPLNMLFNYMNEEIFLTLSENIKKEIIQ